MLDRPTPSLRQRLLPLFLFGSLVAAIRLLLDAVAPFSPATMYFGIYYLMPFALAWIGFTRRWGVVRWKTVAITMVALGFVVWGPWNTIAYTTGQFMEWTHGRFDPGREVVAADGTVSWVDGRAAPVQDSVGMKLAMGVVHGVLSSITSSVWCVVFGTLLIWVPGRPRR